MEDEAQAVAEAEDAEATPATEETQPESDRPGTPEPGEAPEATPAADAAEGQDDEGPSAAAKTTDEDRERDLERRVQAAIRKHDEKTREKAAREAQEQADKELRDLVEKADKGDERAQQQLLDRQLSTLRGQYRDRETQEKLDAQKADLWKRHLDAFGLGDDDEDDFTRVDAKAGLKGINALAITKTADAALVKSMLANPAVQASIKAQVKAATEKAANAAQKKGMAKALGSPEAPKSDTARGGAKGGAVTIDDLEQLIMDEPNNREAQEQYLDLLRKSGQPL